MEKEEEGEFGIYGVTWLGNILFGLYPDEQEKEIESRIELFNYIYQEYEKYYSISKTKDVNLSIDKYKSWSARKASFKGIAKKVFQGLKTNDNTFILWNEGIYFEDYTLEGKTYKVAVYSAKENIELNKNIRIKSFSELRYNKSIKAGYTKNYGLIAFYDTDGKMHMVIQIIGENPEKDVKQWLNYLGLLLPSKEQEEGDKEIVNKILDAILHNLDELNKIWGEKQIKKEEEKPPIEQVISDNLHVKQAPKQCLNACEKIIQDAGYTHDRTNVMALVTNVNGYDFEFHRECVLKAVEVIDQHLESGMPIIVGINYQDGASNFDGVTDHWIVITARGKDEQGIYYNFFEVAQYKDLGVSKNNKLYLLPSGILKGKCTCNKNYEYQWVTMVRPLGEFNFKCCGREIYMNDIEGWGNWKKYCEECRKDPGYYNKNDEKQTNSIPKP